MQQSGGGSTTIILFAHEEDLLDDVANDDLAAPPIDVDMRPSHGDCTNIMDVLQIVGADVVDRAV